METRKNLLMVMAVVWLSCGMASAGEWWVDPSGSDDNSGTEPNYPFATIRKALWQCKDWEYDKIHVNTGTYETGPLFLKSKLEIDFEPNVTVKAWPIVDNPNDPNDPDDPNSFRNFTACLFDAISKNNIIIYGNDTTFDGVRDQYPKTWSFDTCLNVDSSANSITIENHGYKVGDEVRYTWPSNCKACTEIGELNYRQHYNIIVVDADTVKLALNFEDAQSGTEVNLTSAPSPQTHVLSGGEFRHGISLKSCSNVEISCLTSKSNRGDGIRVGEDIDNQDKKYCDDITIKNVTCDNNYRSGMSIISVDGLTIEKCLLKDANGTAPQAGINFEPWDPSQILKNIVMRDCIAERNSYGIKISPAILTDSTDVSFLIQNCNVIGSTDYAISFGLCVFHLYDNGPSGEVIFKNCKVENTGRGIRVYKKSKKAASVVFQECVVKDTWAPKEGNWWPHYPISLGNKNEEKVKHAGGVEFIDCQVVDSNDRAAISWSGEPNELYEVHGDIYVDDPNCTGALWDWNGAALHNVDITLHSEDIDTCKAHNFSRDMEYDTERGHICYTTINSAIDNASDCNEIEVYPGTHYENIDFDGKAITVRSGDPCDWDVVERTIIDGNDLDDTVTFDSSEDENSVLKGFTITNGGTYGIYCASTSPVISNCIIEENYYGVHCLQSSPTITSNKISGGSGAGIFCGTATAATILNNWIYDNNKGIHLAFAGSTEITNNTIADNTGYGVRRLGGTAPTITNCIIWDNNDDLSNCSATYSCITDPCDATGTGNITTDPNFVDAANNDYHLNMNSPCINAGDPCYSPASGEKDIDGDERVLGGRIDMGGDETCGRVYNINKDLWYCGIQDAIDESSGGDELVAWEDTYYENVDFDGKAITVRSKDPNDWDVVAATIIDADDLDNTVTFDSSENENSVLSGFTITGGYYNGVYCYGTSPVISKCIIKGNTDGIRTWTSSSPLITNNKIYNNSNNGVWTFAGTPIIRSNCIFENSSGMLVGGNNNSSNIKNNTIVDNTYYGIEKGIMGTPTPTITNCIIWGHDDDDLDSAFSATYSCIEDPCDAGGTGNITSDPCFVDAANDDYWLTHGSGCIDSANGNVDPPTDIDGQTRIDDPNTPNTGIGDPNYVDMGAYEYNPN